MKTSSNSYTKKSLHISIAWVLTVNTAYPTKSVELNQNAKKRKKGAIKEGRHDDMIQVKRIIKHPTFPHSTKTCFLFFSLFIYFLKNHFMAFTTHSPVLKRNLKKTGQNPHHLLHGRQQKQRQQQQYLNN